MVRRGAGGARSRRAQRPRLDWGLAGALRAGARRRRAAYSSAPICVEYRAFQATSYWLPVPTQATVPTARAAV